MINHGSSPGGEHRVLQFRRGRRPQPAMPQGDDLAKYTQTAGPDDYWHRMLVNAAAFVFVAALVAAGLWLASAMADLRRNEDCVLSGRLNCLPMHADKDRY